MSLSSLGWRNAKSRSNSATGPSTEDDGTARDKVTRIQHLAAISNRRRREDQSGFQVIACIDGRGFGVRREDMRKLLQATKGKVFTLATLDHLIEYTELQRLRSA